MRLLYIVISFSLICCVNPTATKESNDEIDMSNSLLEDDDSKPVVENIQEKDKIYLFGSYYYNQDKNEAMGKFDNLTINNLTRNYTVKPYYYQNKLQNITLTSHSPHDIKDLIELFTEKYNKGYKQESLRQQVDCVDIPSIQSITRDLRNLSDYEKMSVEGFDFKYSATINNNNSVVNNLSIIDLSTVPHYNCTRPYEFKFDNSSYHIHLKNKTNRKESIFYVVPRFKKVCSLANITTVKWFSNNKEITLKYFKFLNNSQLSTIDVYPNEISDYYCTISFSHNKPRKKIETQENPRDPKLQERENKRTKERI